MLFFQMTLEAILKKLEGRLSYDPSIYVYVPAVADKSLAPEGKTGIYVLMPTPELKTGSGIDWVR